MKRSEVFALLRAGDFTGVGCYPVFLLCADGGAIHPSCAKANALAVGRAKRNHDSQWAVVGAGCNWEDSDMVCDECNERIESAYAEPEGV
jgi:hypothetical protein